MNEPRRFFQHDAFISYAHRDNETGIVGALSAQLTEFLQHSLPWEPSIWLDEQSLDNAADLEKQIRLGLREAAILIVIASENVESRPWCRSELGWFLTSADLDRIALPRLYPALLPAGDPALLPRWITQLQDFPFVLDVSRVELLAEQSIAEHEAYWNSLYAWFSSLSGAIERIHAAFHEINAPSGER